MIVFVDDDVVFEALSSENFFALHALFSFGKSGKHILIGDFEPWFSLLDQITATGYKSIVENSIRLYTTYPANAAGVRIKLNSTQLWNDPIAELSLENGLRLLQEPLGLFFENSTNDWHFLRKLVTQPEREKLDTGVANGWIVILHGGGSDIVQNIANRAVQGYTALRTFALFDSDRHHQDELDQAWHPINNIQCQGYKNEMAAISHLGKRYWRLNRRFIESYMPKAQLCKYEQENANVKSGITEAYFRMDKNSRWFYNMKDGLSNQKNHALSRQQNLYSSLTVQDANLLHNGYGSGLGSTYVSSNDTFSWDSDALSEASRELPKLLRLI